MVKNKKWYIVREVDRKDGSVKFTFHYRKESTPITFNVEKLIHPACLTKISKVLGANQYQAEEVRNTIISVHRDRICDEVYYTFTTTTLEVVDNNELEKLSDDVVNIVSETVLLVENLKRSILNVPKKSIYSPKYDMWLEEFTEEDEEY